MGTFEEELDDLQHPKLHRPYLAYRDLLARALRVADSGFYHDLAGFSLRSHPLWDEVMQALKERRS